MFPFHHVDRLPLVHFHHVPDHEEPYWPTQPPHSSEAVPYGIFRPPCPNAIYNSLSLILTSPERRLTVLLLQPSWFLLSRRSFLPLKTSNLMDRFLSMHWSLMMWWIASYTGTGVLGLVHQLVQPPPLGLYPALPQHQLLRCAHMPPQSPGHWSVNCPAPCSAHPTSCWYGCPGSLRHPHNHVHQLPW